VGASPRARGNRGAAAVAKGREGCIPACAGEPSVTVSGWTPMRVHPRVRGGTSTGCLLTVCQRGASPRARGNRGAAAVAKGREGCIPACAGEPARSSAFQVFVRVHPRVRGGTAARATSRGTGSGASPRARGNRQRVPACFVHFGCIPACAGEPIEDFWSAWTQTVHPRVRGGTILGAVPPWLGRGASPRARGNPGWWHSSGGTAGCIPACAGEPPSSSWSRRPARVHPRVRGGTRPSVSGVAVKVGASPRARGNRRNRIGRVRTERCIPACAGEPLLPFTWMVVWRVHPRVRGGTTSSGCCSGQCKGASPRARGNHVIGMLQRAVQGCIPACAGEPPGDRARASPARVHPRVRGGT